MVKNFFNTVPQTLLFLKRSKIYPIFIVIFFLNTFMSVLISVGGIGNFRIFPNISESMYPEIKIGDLVIVHKRNNYNYKVGDVISFYGKYKENYEIITHRVFKIGGNVYLTKGDNNLLPDPYILVPRLIIGEVILTVPKIGNFIVSFKTAPSRIAYIMLPMFLIIFIELTYLSRIKKASA